MKKDRPETESDAGGTYPMAFPHDREPRVNGEEALKVHRLIDRLLQSAG